MSKVLITGELCNPRSTKIKRSLENEVDFRDIMNVSSNVLAKNQNFKKQRHGFVDESALITTILTFSCHWKTLVPFNLPKKRPENTFLGPVVNYREIVQKNKLCHPKQQRIGYLMIYDAIYLLLVLIEKLAFSENSCKGLLNP